jgi:hypothetical protein
LAGQRLGLPAACLWRNKEGRECRADQGQAPPQRRSTIRIEFGNDTCEEHKIKINKVVRSNLSRP